MVAEVTGVGTISADEFLALEQKVLRAVEVIKKEREARAAAEAQLAAAKLEIADLEDKLAFADLSKCEDIEILNREREVVRERVEKMLAQMDELL
jgi:hypothetical protein